MKCASSSPWRREEEEGISVVVKGRPWADEKRGKEGAGRRKEEEEVMDCICCCCCYHYYVYHYYYYYYYHHPFTVQVMREGVHSIPMLRERGRNIGNPYIVDYTMGMGGEI